MRSSAGWSVSPPPDASQARRDWGRQRPSSRPYLPTAVAHLVLLSAQGVRGRATRPPTTADHLRAEGRSFWNQPWEKATRWDLRPTGLVAPWPTAARATRRRPATRTFAAL